VTREVGAALGIAALGSIMASRFHSAMEGPTSALPHDVREVAQESVGQALAVAQRIGGDAGAELADSARRAFTEGISLAFVVAAVIMAIAGYVFGRLMPNSLPTRIIPSAVQTSETLELDAS
jgi:DHA2 family multidrug resistance protein-like MFS transporter